MTWLREPTSPLRAYFIGAWSSTLNSPWSRRTDSAQEREAFPSTSAGTDRLTHLQSTSTCECVNPSTIHCQDQHAREGSRLDIYGLPAGDRQGAEGKSPSQPGVANPHHLEFCAARGKVCRESFTEVDCWLDLMPLHAAALGSSWVGGFDSAYDTLAHCAALPAMSGEAGSGRNDPEWSVPCFRVSGR